MSKALASFKKEMDEFVDEFAERIGCNHIGWYQNKISGNLFVFGLKPNKFVSFDRETIKNVGQSYPTKSSARIACKEAVTEAVEDMREQFFKCSEKFTAIANSGRNRLLELFDTFIENYPKTFEENIALECGGEEAEILGEVCNKLAEPVEKMKGEFAEETAKAVEGCRSIYSEEAEKLFDISKWASACEIKNDSLGNFSFEASNAWEKAVIEANRRSKEADMRHWDEAIKVLVEITKKYCDRLKEMLADALDGAFGAEAASEAGERKEINDFIDRFIERSKKDERWRKLLVCSSAMNPLFGFRFGSSFGSGKYVYPSKNDARNACGEAMTTAAEELHKEYYECADIFIKNAKKAAARLSGITGEFFDKCAEMFDVKIGGGKSLTDTLDELKQELSEKLSAVPEDCKYVYDEDTEGFFDASRLSERCEYKSEIKGKFCYNAKSVCDKFVSEAVDLNEKANGRYINDVYDRLVEVTREYCERLKETLNASLPVFGENGEINVILRKFNAGTRYINS